MEQKSQMQIQIRPQEKLHELGDLFGIFFEDISYASDGGLYGELIQNRSFEFDHMDNPQYHALYGWECVERGSSLARMHAETQKARSKNTPHYVKLEVMKAGIGGGIRNGGFYDGIPVQKGKNYNFSCFYLLESGSREMIVRLEDAQGEVIAEEKIVLDSSSEIFRRDEEKGWKETEEKAWARTESTLTAGEDCGAAYLTVLFDKAVCICLDQISLFPEETFLGRKNGLRADLAQLLCGMKPKFVRFPGGCFMHIGSLDAGDRAGMFRWKNTLGPAEERPPRSNLPWHYHITGGLGFYEFFQFCEDIGAEPLPVVSAGVDPHNLRFAPLNAIQEWIDEACDLIEFANGAADTKWGSVRAEMGHPAPFHLKYLAIGNEEVGAEFFERYEIISLAVHEKYPEIQLIGSGGPGESGSEFDKGWETARRTPTSFVDEHYYQGAEWLIANVDRYQSYGREPRAFLGEYASKGNTLYDALAESVYMTGMERSSGIGLACYAPLFACRGHQNWSPDLIWFDKESAFGSVSYHAQKLFMNYQGDAECALTVTEIADGGSGEAEVDPVEVLRAAAAGKCMKEQDGEKTEDCAGKTEGKPEKGTEQRSAGISGQKISGKMRYFDTLTGPVRLFSDGAQVEVADVRINGESVLEYTSLSGAGERAPLGAVQTERFEISFKARKCGGTMTDTLEGPCFGLEFAITDEENLLILALDGWEQLNSIRGIVDGQGFTAGDAYAELPFGKWMGYRLIVNGRSIVIQIGGEDVLCTEICFPEHRRLYCSSSVDEKTGDIFFKAVNVNAEPVRACVELAEDDGRELSGSDRGEIRAYEEAEDVKNLEKTVDAPETEEWKKPCRRTGKITEVESYTLTGKPTDENTFEAPEKVVPVCRSVSSKELADYEFPAFSLTVLCIHTK